MSFPMSEPLEIDDVDCAYLTVTDRTHHKNIAGCSSFCHCGLDANKRRYSKPMGNHLILNCIYNHRTCFISICLVILNALLLLFATSAFHPNAAACDAYGSNASASKTSFNQTSNSSELYTKSGEPYPWKSIRLPDFIRPVHYDLFMHPNLTTFLNKGSVEILITALDNVNFIVLNVKELNLTDFYLTKASYSQIKIRRHLIYEPFEQLYIELDEYLEKSHNYTLKIDFCKILEEKLEGFYLSSYTDFASNRKKYLATTHFEPTFARSGFPCFDEPALKATFALKMVHDQHYDVFSNADQQTKAIYNRDGLMITAFDSSVKMSTYLVAFIVCDFKILSDRTKDGIHVRVIVPRDQYARAEYALKTATAILSYFQDFFNMSYPLTKLDLVAVPDFQAGAMENWGLITFRTTMILFDPNISSNEVQENVAIVIAHELAHQWFGNLVTPEFWDHLWLSEGFASYVEYLGVDYIYPEWQMIDQFVLSTTQEALALDCLRSSHAIQPPTNKISSSPRQIEAMFDTISYKKGATLIRMLQNFLSNDVLRLGLRSYLNKYQYSVAKTDDLWRTLSSVVNSSINVTAIMERYVLQKNFPLVTAIRQKNKVFLSQKRYLACCENEVMESDDENDDVSPFGYQWIIPITILTSKEPRRAKLTWLSSANSAFILDNYVDWFKLNINSTGYFRVNYDEQNWIKLSNLLRKRDFSHHLLMPTDRANLLDDAFSLMKSGHLSPEIAMNLSLYLEVSERDYTPWLTALAHFNTLDAIMLSNPLLHRFVRKLIIPSVTFFAWKNSDTHLNSKLRSALLDSASIFGEENTIKQANRYFANCMRNNFQIPPDLRLTVYSTGVRTGDVDEWNFAWSKYINTKVPSEQRLLLKALSQTRNPWLLNQFLSYSLDKDKIKPQDTAQVIIDVARNVVGRPLVWKFIRENWDTILNLFGKGSFTMDEIISETTCYFSSEFEYNEVKEFFTHVNVGSGVQSVQQTLEKIRSNIFWKKNIERKVIEWLRKQSY